MKENNPIIPFSSELKQRIEAFAKQLIDDFTTHAKELAKELQATDEMNLRVEERIKRGGRRTSGKIV